MAPLEALRSGPHDAEAFAGMLDSLGTVRAGKVAHLVLHQADPLVEIRDVSRAHAVIARGRVCGGDRLTRLLPDATR